MKAILALTSLAASALAQRIAIGAPAGWSQVAPGSNITVRVDRPLTLTGSEEVAIAIGFWPCGGPCAAMDVTQVLGNVVYRGAYDPQLVEPGVPPFQTFTVALPSYFRPGEVSLGVAHFSLIGAGMMPFMEVANVTLNLVSQSK